MLGTTYHGLFSLRTPLSPPWVAHGWQGSEVAVPQVVLLEAGLQSLLALVRHVRVAPGHSGTAVTDHVHHVCPIRTRTKQIQAVIVQDHVPENPGCRLADSPPSTSS